MCSLQQTYNIITKGLRKKEMNMLERERKKNLQNHEVGVGGGGGAGCDQEARNKSTRQKYHAGIYTEARN